jgi:hypothetical protein
MSGKTPAAASRAFAARLWFCPIYPFRQEVLIEINMKVSYEKTNILRAQANICLGRQ